AALGLGLAGLARPVARWFERAPTIAESAEMIHAGRYDEAERALARFVADHPDHREGNILLGQVLIDRPNPRPSEALAHLDRVRSRSPQVRASVLVLRGKALYQLSRMAESEADWREAMRLEPHVPEAGWLLIQQYYVQGRRDEGRRLALALYPVETNPIDRV